MTTIDGMTVEERGGPERTADRLPVMREWKRLCDDFTTVKSQRDAAESRVAESEARAERYRGALEEIVGNENDPCMGRECRDTPRLRRREWCPSCIARAALAPPADGGGGE